MITVDLSQWLKSSWKQTMIFWLIFLSSFLFSLSTKKSINRRLLAANWKPVKILFFTFPIYRREIFLMNLDSRRSSDLFFSNIDDFQYVNNSFSQHQTVSYHRIEEKNSTLKIGGSTYLSTKKLSQMFSTKAFSYFIDYAQERIRKRQSLK